MSYTCYVCDNAKRTFDTDEKLRKHMNRHKKELCSICKTEYYYHDTCDEECINCYNCNKYFCKTCTKLEFEKKYTHGGNFEMCNDCGEKCGWECCRIWILKDGKMIDGGSKRNSEKNI
jgi:hypothetical protein